MPHGFVAPVAEAGLVAPGVHVAGRKLDAQMAQSEVSWWI